jgi:hypothetical protein
MHWKYKAHLLACLSRLPGGRSIYHWLQRVAGTNRLQLQRDLQRAFELVDLVFAARGELAGARVVEIGTGWRPLVPYVLALGGARQVITLDINPWLTLQYARETWQALEPVLPEIAARCQVPVEQVRERYLRVPPQADTLQEMLQPLGIEYRYPADARSTGLSSGSVDLIVSSNVLEHIPREIQLEIHRESRRILQRGGLSVHRFNPQDHFSTVDSSITFANFLRFSSAEWHWLGGSGLAYHNRLRSRDYLELFAAAGLEVRVHRERIDQRSLAAIRSGELPVHPEFQGYTPEELAVDYMWLAAAVPHTVTEINRTETRRLAGV